MLGWRARIGYINPSNAECSVYEFYKIAPEGVTLVLTCLSIKNLVPEELETALAKVDAAAVDLARSEVDYIVLGGTPPAVFKGVEGNKKLIERIENLTKIPAVTKVSASMAAFNYLGAKRISLVSPMDEDNNRKIRRFLEEAGFEVVCVVGLGIKSNLEITKLPPYASYQAARRAIMENPETDVIYIPCSLWGATLNAQHIETDFGIPVVTSNNAMMWYVFRALNIREKIRGYGKLLAEI